MHIISYTISMREPFSCLLADYFSELNSDIPESIIKGKLLNLIESMEKSRIIYISLVEQDNKFIGFSIYQVDTEKSDWCKRPGWGFIREFYIIPEFRRLGMGRKLAAFSHNKLLALGARNCYLTSGTPEFWLSCGWHATDSVCSNDLPILEK